MKKLFALVIMVVGIFAASSVFAISAPYMALYFNDNAGNEFIYTNMSTPGQVTFNGAVGNWNINVSTLLSYPAYGTQAVPRMDLNSVNKFAGGQGTLTVMACVINFDPSPGAGFEVALGGTTAGTVKFAGYSSKSVDFFTLTNLLFESPLYSAGGSKSIAYSGEFSGAVPAGSTSYTLAAYITSPGPTSFDIDYKVPEPTSLMLLGLGLLGIAGIRRKH